MPSFNHTHKHAFSTLSFSDYSSHLIFSYSLLSHHSFPLNPIISILNSAHLIPHAATRASPLLRLGEAWEDLSPLLGRCRAFPATTSALYAIQVLQPFPCARDPSRDPPPRMCSLSLARNHAHEAHHRYIAKHTIIEGRLYGPGLFLLRIKAE